MSFGREKEIPFLQIMDEATKLVGELSRKLTELDHKVDLYRDDMNKEYIKYEEDLLRNIPQDVSKKVSTIIADLLKNYKALHPVVESKVTGENFDSCAIGSSNSNKANNDPSSNTSTHANKTTNSINGLPSMESQKSGGTGTSPSLNTSVPIIPNIAKEEVVRPRSPHAREKEFTGVFTPSYLPLLDSNSRYEQRSSPNIELDNTPKDVQMDASHVDASTDTRSLNPSPDPRSPTPKRKNTDELSIASTSSSDGPRRRSALRRTSSNSKNTSPRRVRFDVEGEEVLPTASPKELEPMLPPSLSDDSDDEAGSEMVEDIDAPPPKRISSSQALRALSRGPPEDDGTQWTTVIAPPDGSASLDTLDNDNSTSHYCASKSSPTTSHTENIPPISIPTKSPLVEPQAQVKHTEALTEDDTDALSGDDMLDMPPLRQVKSQKKQSASILSPRKNENQEQAHTLTMKQTSKPLTLENLEPREVGDERSTTLTFQDDEQEDLFSFDENPNRGTRPQDEEDESDLEEPTSSSIEESLDNLDLSKSPARQIPNSFSNKKPANHPVPAHGVVGSYKGRPFSMPVVDDQVHATAASMGAMNSFVGSVNGRSGLDASDILSFRASGGVGSFSGTPRSMSERMLLDDLMEAEGDDPRN